MPAQLPGIAELPVRRWRDGSWEETRDEVAEEAPVALTFNSIPHVVMLATPRDLVDLGRGFAFTEALVAHPEEIRAAELKQDGEALEVALSVPQERLVALLQQRRNLTGRTGCGVCGAETIEQAIRHPPAVATGWCDIADATGGGIGRVAQLAAAGRIHWQPACCRLG